MKVLVTGASGFIGGWVCRELAVREHEVVAFDRRREARIYWDTFLGDMTRAEDVTEAFAHADAFIHLAGVLGTQETISNPRPAALGNIVGGLNVLEAAAQYGLPGVYIAVGNHWMENTYSISKTTVERFVRMFNAERGTRVATVRCVNAFGPGQIPAAPFGPSKVRKIIPAFICRALTHQPIEVYGDGSQISDCVYVEDVARVLVDALELANQGKGLREVLEVGPLTHHSVDGIAHIVAGMFGTGQRIKYLPMRPGEEPGAQVSANLETLLRAGINPDTRLLAEGIAETGRWLKEYLDG